MQSPEVADDYYKVLSDRIAVRSTRSSSNLRLTQSLQDTGLSVRKRIVKLLKSLYESGGGGKDRRIDICTKLVSRMVDDDDSVKVRLMIHDVGNSDPDRQALAIKTLEDLWLGASPSASEKKGGSLEPTSEHAADERAHATAFVIMGVAANHGERQSPLEDLFHQVRESYDMTRIALITSSKIATSKEGQESSAVMAKYTEICDALIESLVDNQPGAGFVSYSSGKHPHFLTIGL